MTTALVWFRRDLSLVDNVAFLQATAFDEVACVWVHEPTLVNGAGPFRRANLAAALRSLDAELALRGGQITVLTGPAQDAIARFAVEIGASRVFWNADVSRYAQSRDASVEQSLARRGIPASTSWGTLVQPPGSVVTAAGNVPRIFTVFYNRWSVLPLPPAPREGGATVRNIAGDLTLAEVANDGADVDGTGGSQRLQRFLAVVADYDETRNRVDVDGTSHLSRDLHLGTVSARHAVNAVGAATPGARAFLRQLAWRDWFAHLFYERPELARRAQQSAYDAIAWRNDPVEIDAWRRGQTGYPIVDAAMRELAATGWLHGRLRMVAASFLVKDLLVDWRIGERHFRRLLIDGDVSANAGNWQWTAGTGPDAAPYFRVMNPSIQGRRIDPNGQYVRRWVPELAELRGGRIHTPNECDAQELADAGVILGESYPAPLVNHATARARALLAYSTARHGPPPG